MYESFADRSGIFVSNGLLGARLGASSEYRNVKRAPLGVSKPPVRNVKFVPFDDMNEKLPSFALNFGAGLKEEYPFDLVVFSAGFDVEVVVVLCLDVVVVVVVVVGGQHYVPRFLCSPVPMFPEPMFPGTYVPRYQLRCCCSRFLLAASSSPIFCMS